MDSRSCFCNLAILALFLALSLTLGESSGNRIKCEELEKTRCAFAVSWSGKRCVLEKQVKRTGEEAFTCRTSEIEADRLQNIVETEECVEGCGLDRNNLGISSDLLLDNNFTTNLCSCRCYNHCPNVVDLFFNLAAGEGVFLPKLCEAKRSGNVRREMAEMRSSGFVAPGPIKPISLTSSMAPAIAPGPLHLQPISLLVAPTLAPIADHGA